MFARGNTLKNCQKSGLFPLGVRGFVNKLQSNPM